MKNSDSHSLQKKYLLLVLILLSISMPTILAVYVYLKYLSHVVGGLAIVCASIFVALLLSFLVLFIYLNRRQKNEIEVANRLVLADDNELHMTQLLNPVLRQLVKTSIAIKNKNHTIESKLKSQIKKSHRINDEVLIAKQIQKSLLRHDFHSLQIKNQLDVYADLVPVTEVGGDFYDAFMLDENNLFIAVGDVCGKGIPACMMMSQLMALIRTLMTQPANEVNVVNDLSAVMNMLQKSFFYGDEKQYVFATVLMATLHLKTGELRYCSAGHNPIFIMSYDGEQSRYLQTSSKPIGLRRNTSYSVLTHQLNPGDYVFLYTDGIVETDNAQHEYFSDINLAIALQGRAGLSARKMITGLWHALSTFRYRADQVDDITALAVRWCAQPLAFSQQPSIVAQKSYEMTYMSTIKEVSKAQIEIKSFLQANGIADRVYSDIELSIEEVMVNIIKHAYGHQESQSIIVRVDLCAEGLYLTFSDNGPLFNPLHSSATDMLSKRRQSIAGGRGLLIVKNLMDKVDYTYRDEKNILTLYKNIERI